MEKTVRSEEKYKMEKNGLEVIGRGWAKLKITLAVNFSEKLAVSSKIRLSVNGCQ